MKPANRSRSKSRVRTITITASDSSRVYVPISVIVPCHNEEEGVRAVIEQMPPVVDEILVVDNASTDRTAEVAREL